MPHPKSKAFLYLLTLAALLTAPAARAYSLLTHEELIDLTWQSAVVPLILSRYPTLTPAQLEHARAFAYGGCVIQDIGYYPLGDAFFSDLTHYVRSGDFVVNLFRNATNADELAFAVGALSHYIGDTYGHSQATNLAVPVEFPALRARYGHVVTYGEGEHQHVQTEFAFDIDQIAHHRLAPVHYLRHVGLQVPTAQLDRAFYATYGLGEDFAAHRKRRINVGAYRFAVHRFIPRIAYALNVLHRSHEPADLDNPELQQLQRELAVIDTQNGWNQYRRHPGPGTYALAAFIRVLPKLGPLKLLAIKGPTPQTEADYIHSVVHSEDLLAQTLHHFTPPQYLPAPNAPSSRPQLTSVSEVERPAVLPRQTPEHPVQNLDLDTGHPTRPSAYALTDATYATLAHRLAATPTHPIPPGVQADILAYYSDLTLPFATKANSLAWAALQKSLATLSQIPTTPEATPFPTYNETPPATAH